MARTIRFAALTILVSSAIAAATGCASNKPTADMAAAADATPNFFVANRWVDQDSSGGADYWEFEGANKWTYRSDESITFVSRIEAERGAKVTWQLRGPNGEILDQDESIQRWPSTWRRAYSGSVIDLLDVGGPGVYWVEWYINGQRIGECAANLVP